MITARGEGAGLRPGDHVARGPPDRSQRLPARAVQPRDGGQQPFGVTVSRMGEQLLPAGGLDDPPAVHDVDEVAQTGHHPEVVGDHDHGRVQVGHQLLEQLQHLRLDGDVEGGGRLVADQQGGLAGQRDRDQRPLPHPPGHLVGVLLEPAAGVGDAAATEQLLGLRPGLGPGHVGVAEQHLGHLDADRHHRVERAHRVLEHHGDLAAAQVVQRLRPGSEQVLAAVADLAGGGDTSAGQQPHHGQRGDRLAAAALPHDAHHLARAHLERHPVHGVHRSRSLAGEGDRQVVDLEQVLLAVHAGPWPAASHHLGHGRSLSGVQERSGTTRPLAQANAASCRIATNE